jgi:hypothetical protein
VMSSYWMRRENIADKCRPPGPLPHALIQRGDGLWSISSDVDWYRSLLSFPSKIAVRVAKKTQPLLKR